MFDGGSTQNLAQAACGTPITVSLKELARRVRTEILRSGGHDWGDDVYGRDANDPAARIGIDPAQLDEAAIVASYYLLGRIAQGRECYRVAREAFQIANFRLCMSAAYGKFKPKPEAAERMPPGWREHFLPIIRQRGEYDELVRPG